MCEQTVDTKASSDQPDQHAQLPTGIRHDYIARCARNESEPASLTVRDDALSPALSPAMIWACS
ncbi:hypothetical protein GCM10017608_18990 [Agromyces luteolus]|nr:hypothetical protein GCM10017608_18990 [Agromyces luteolus]